MATTMASPAVTTHPQRLQDRLRLPRLPVAKADLKKVQKHAKWVLDGTAVLVCIGLACKRQKEAAADVGLSESQLAAMIAGTERPQTELFEAHDTYAAPMQVAKALQKPDVFEVRWTITAAVQR